MTTETTQSLSLTFDVFNMLDAKTEHVISLLPSMSDEQVKETYHYAKSIGAASLRIETAAHAEVLKRIQSRAWQRDGLGVKATLTDVARELGSSPRDIYRNAQIHNTFFADENCADVGTVLLDKGYYQEALSASNPHAAIGLITAKKIECSSYSVLDARRDVEAMRSGRFEQTPELPPDTFNLILADPPWQYDFSVSECREIENHYPTMTAEEICALPVSKLAAPDCVLFLWATSPKLDIAFDVIEAWGFTYKTCMVWAKDKIGMGYYARQQHEILLIATTGNPGVPDAAVRPPSVITAPRTKHSAKPDVFRETIETMFPAATKIELFSRSPKDGWDVWGNETTAGKVQQ